MDLEFWAITFDFVGKVLLGVMAVLVHMRIKKEQKIDAEVLKEMKLEQGVVLLAIIMLLVAYILHLKII